MGIILYLFNWDILRMFLYVCDFYLFDWRNCEFIRRYYYYWLRKIDLCRIYWNNFEKWLYCFWVERISRVLYLVIGNFSYGYFRWGSYGLCVWWFVDWKSRGLNCVVKFINIFCVIN